MYGIAKGGKASYIITQMVIVYANTNLRKRCVNNFCTWMRSSIMTNEEIVIVCFPDCMNSI